MKVRKRTLIAITIILVCGITIYNIFFSEQLLGVNNKSLGEKIKFSDVCNEEPSQVSRLLIRSGKDGVAYETRDKEKIEEFITLMNSIKFIKEKNQEPTVGWTYYVNLFDSEDDKEWFRIGFSRVNFEKHFSWRDVRSSDYYYMENEKEIMVKLDDYYNSLKKLN